MTSNKATWIAVGLLLASSPVWAQNDAPATAPAAGRAARGPQPNWYSAPGREDGPSRVVWAAQKTPETPYNAINKPIWHIADVIKAHKGQARWEQKVLLNRDFDGPYYFCHKKAQLPYRATGLLEPLNVVMRKTGGYIFSNNCSFVFRRL